MRAALWAARLDAPPPSPTIEVVNVNSVGAASANVALTVFASLTLTMAVPAARAFGPVPPVETRTGRCRGFQDNLAADRELGAA